MLYNTVHNRWLRLVVAVLGELITAVGINLFIVPKGLYSGGTLGVCQLIRTMLQTYLHLDFGSYDIAGILYLLASIPILVFAYRVLGWGLAVRTIVCTLAYSLFSTIIPIPAQPIIDDYLTASILGGILYGVGCGIVLTCGCTGGGLDTVGLCLSKRGSNITVGRFSILFNVVVYAFCLLFFSPEVTIYSVVYNFVTNMMLDRTHKQNITVQALIFTRTDEHALGQFVMGKLGRGVTYWQGTGAYTGEDVHVLCVCLSKYEIEELLHAVHSIDPHAFVTVEEGVHVYGNYQRKVE